VVVKNILSAFVAGLLFGLGLCISRMVDPSVVIGFLDMTGSWDPRLLFVMGGALIVTTSGYAFVKRKCSRPICSDQFFIPENNLIDLRLVIGAVLFGIGWGLGGVCPGPAIVALVFYKTNAIVFCFAMLLGMIIFNILEEKKKILS
jgi:uncharacterized membrane protein YedE/YeeE